MTRELWPHQQRGIDAHADAVRRGVKRLCLTAPTGMGKTALLEELIRRDLEVNRRVVLYTNRRMLLEQTAGVLDGLNPGIRAAGHHPELHKPFQIASVQTEGSRTLKAEVWDLHKADRVYFDEGHLMTGDTALRLALQHQQTVKDCVITYLTATPLGMQLVADELIVAGTTSEGRKCGALLPAYHYGPSEPWIPPKEKAILDRGEDLSEKKAASVMMRPGIFGLVFDWWKKLNPSGLPTILFAPGVGESLWFAQQFWERGVSAAHIDGEEVWKNGATFRSDRSARDAVMEDSRNGGVKVLCNRFVLREGIDAPWLAHGIFATVFGSMQSYVQSGGRLLRHHPSLTSVIVQDHGGNWWRHGSLNADRVWELDYTPAMIAGERADRIRKGQEAEPFLCPNCRSVLARATCPCGFVVEARDKARPVMMTDGKLSELRGTIFPPKQRQDAPTALKKWVQCYFRARNSGTMTFKQAEALFFQENGYWPLDNLKFMPMSRRDWYRRVIDVPRDDLYT